MTGSRSAAASLGTTGSRLAVHRGESDIIVQLMTPTTATAAATSR